MTAEAAGQVVGSLDPSGMMRNRRVSLALADPEMPGFLARLEYKCLWSAAEYVGTDRWFAYSKLWSRFRWQIGGSTVSETVWRCHSCGTLNRRDANAACNLELGRT